MTDRLREHIAEAQATFASAHDEVAAMREKQKRLLDEQPEEIERRLKELAAKQAKERDRVHRELTQQEINERREAARIRPRDPDEVKQFVANKIGDLIQFIKDERPPTNVFHLNSYAGRKLIPGVPPQTNWRGKVISAGVPARDPIIVAENRKIAVASQRPAVMHFWAGNRVSPQSVMSVPSDSFQDLLPLNRQVAGIALGHDGKLWRWLAGSPHPFSIHNMVSDVQPLEDRHIAYPELSLHAVGNGGDVLDWWDQRITNLAARAVALAGNTNAMRLIPELDSRGVAFEEDKTINQTELGRHPDYVRLMNAAHLPLPGHKGFEGPVADYESPLSILNFSPLNTPA